MKILFLSFYFQPDLSAGSFRNTALVESLLANLPEGSELDVITTLPNRYAGFKAEAPEDEVKANLTIKRIPLPQHESGMADQSRSFLAYAKQVMRFVADRDYDVVFASSSRLMTATLGALIARKKGAPLYLDIRDIFVDTIKEVLPRKLSWLMKPFFAAVERWTVSKADRLNIVSAGFLPYFESRYPSISKVVFTNGIDEEFLRVAPSGRPETVVARDTSSKVDTQDQRIFEILYAGNIGEGQGLHNLVPGLAKSLEGRAKFRLIGGGGRLRQLENAVAKAGCTNVVIEPPIPRSELIEAYKQADVLFLHLNDYEAFRKVLPSKLFEYGALGKPILAGVAGYSASFIEDYLDNAEVFSPCSESEAVEAFERLRIGDAARFEFVKRFSRRRIMDDMARDVIALGEFRS
ncbi:glycosyltransferase family 4 protein [Marinobacter adhaerens]|uniref:glycosyltransferase family 4 protein n=1 Tax=Marinobacter adhaerens TaxID=1033846 RepID=UPI003BA8B7B5